MRQTIIAIALPLLAVTVSVGSFWYLSARPPAPLNHQVDISRLIHWQSSDDEASSLSVVHVPPMGPGLNAPAAPHSGHVTISGPAGAVQAGAIVEVTNTHTGKAQQVTADNTGAFKLDAIVDRGDVLTVFTAKVEFRPSPPVMGQHLTPPK